MIDNDNDGPFGDNQTKVMPETKIWTTKAIKLLIENRGALEHEFNNNKKNHKIWEKISNILKENDIVVSGPNCNTKFRNLMATFKDNVQRAKKSGEGAINWEYYLLMKQYFGKKDSVTPNYKTLLESSLPNTSKISLKNVNKAEKDAKSKRTDEETDSDEGMIPKKKKKSFQDTLLEEMKEDRKSRDNFQNKLENFMDRLIEIETAKLEKI